MTAHRPLWRAWRHLCARRDWDAEPTIAGGGRAVEHWRARIGTYSPEARARVLGFTERVDVLLAAVDLLVSPVRYEAYGLGVHEAVCRGIPVLVSGTAGITERFSDEVRELVVNSPNDADELAARLLGWRSAIDHWRKRFGRFGGELRRYTWTDMAVQIVTLAERPGAEACATGLGMLDA
jgi:glycosyltransferase involved in cell wall biosynthesis